MQLLRSSRISPRLLELPNARIAAEQFADLHTNTVAAMQDELVGYGAAPLPVGSWAMMCHAVISCENLGHALSRFGRFYGLFDIGCGFELIPGSETLTLRLLPKDPAAPMAAYPVENFLFNIYRLSCWLIQAHVPLIAANFTYAPPEQAAEYRLLWLGGAIHFEQPYSELVFPLATTERHLRQNAATLRRLLRYPMLSLLTLYYRNANWAMRVREMLRGSFTTMPELDEVATTLQIHPQTLRRRLMEEGTSFKEVKSRLRRDIALYYLGKPGFSIEEIAYRAGYSESSAFIRAFKGWTGVAPYVYRKGL
ncbi:MAG: AraC family transcriptional regulator [Spongiibacteraceae bacterium]